MGISHEYHSASRRGRHGRGSWKLRLMGAVAAILLVSYAITAILEHGAAAEDPTPEVNASGIAENILAPLPMQGEADSGSDSTLPEGAQAATLEAFGPAKHRRLYRKVLRRQCHPPAQLRAGGSELFFRRSVSG